MPEFLQRVGGAIRRPSRSAASPETSGDGTFGPPVGDEALIDLQRRRDQLNARLAELQWDLGGLVY